MAVVPRLSEDKLASYLELYCEPLSQEEELEIDNEVLQRTIEALPKEAGFTYEELSEQVEVARDDDPEDIPTEVWLFLPTIYGTKAAKTVEENKDLGERVFKFNRIFGDKLVQLHQERKLAYGVFLIAPYFLAGRDRPRLYRLKDMESTPTEALRFFHLEATTELSDHAEVQASDMELLKAEHPQHIWALSMMPSQTIDRAARGMRGWAFPLDDAPTFEDANNKHTVTYFADGLTQEALREGVMQLNPRTADVWRLCTATILELWGEGEREPPRVWLDARELCDTMGFKKHHKGGHRPENVAVAARSLVDLERFYITIPYGAKQYPEDANGKRKATTVQARARHRVLAVMGKEETKQLFDTEWLPLRWLVTAGEWIKAYPREQFAPLFRALVELPGTYTPDLWAKAIGTELIWQYRQDEGKVQKQRVETMLRQACVLDEARQEKNKKRTRDSFEKALDTLQKHGVCTAWEYNGADIDHVETTPKGWFNLWLQARVIVTPPLEVTKALANVAKTKKQYRRRVKKA